MSTVHGGLSEKARAEIALCVSAEVMHIGGPSDHLELSQDEIGIKMMDNPMCIT
jgi:hypothetical protein